MSGSATGTLTRAWRGWERFWFRRFDPLPAAWFRIALGALLVVWFLAATPNWERFYAADGQLALDRVDPLRKMQDWWSAMLWTESWLPVRAYWVAGLIASIGFTAGCFTRTCTITLYVLVTSMMHRNSGLVNGEDLLFRMLLFYSCFAPLGAALSFDVRRAQRRGRRIRRPRIWPVRLIQINLALIYAFSLPDKLTLGPEWLEGTAIYYSLMSDYWGRLPLDKLFYNSLVTGALTYGTLVVEAAVPLLVWFERWRLPVVIAGLALHLGIAVIVANVTFFTLGMAAALLLYLPAGDYRALGVRLRRRRSQAVVSA